jgi:hypothetical protein
VSDAQVTNEKLLLLSGTYGQRARINSHGPFPTFAEWDEMGTTQLFNYHLVTKSSNDQDCGFRPQEALKNNPQVTKSVIKRRKIILATHIFVSSASYTHFPFD